MMGSYWSSTNLDATDYASRISFYHHWNYNVKGNNVPMWYDEKDKVIRFAPENMSIYDVLWYDSRTGQYRSTQQRNWNRLVSVDSGFKSNSYGLDFGEYSRSNHFSVRLVRDAN